VEETQARPFLSIARLIGLLIIGSAANNSIRKLSAIFSAESSSSGEIEPFPAPVRHPLEEQ
jgi:hypothetical protein